jgi:hypothetical protein
VPSQLWFLAASLNYDQSHYIARHLPTAINNPIDRTLHPSKQTTSGQALPIMKWDQMLLLEIALLNTPERIRG